MKTRRIKPMQTGTIRFLLFLSLFLTAAPAALRAAALGISVSGVSVHLEEDSLCVEMRLDLTVAEVSPSEALFFTPVLRSGSKVAELPPVVVTGKRRFRFDRREAALASPSAGDTSGCLRCPPFRVLFGNSPHRGNAVSYTARIAYVPWMGHANLSLMQERKECCGRDLLGIDELLATVGLPESPQPESQRASAVQSPADSTAISRTILTAAVPGLSCSLMVSYLVPELETDKQRSESVTLYIDYPLNSYDVQKTYRRNASELSRLDSLLHPLRSDGGLATIRRLGVCGYASPEGPYRSNEELASNRARHFMHYMTRAYHLPADLATVTWVPEDWEGLESLLRERHPAYYEEALELIRRYGVFEGREKRLMELHGGEPYRRMCSEEFPLLRRLRITVSYAVRSVDAREAARLIYTHPQMLSLQEMYGVAQYYRPGTEQYREVYEIAAWHFPGDVLAHINAASAVLLAGDLVSAHKYLDRFADDSRAWNDLGVLALLEGRREEAAAWFRKAMGVEPYKARKNLEAAEGRADTYSENLNRTPSPGGETAP